MENYVVEGAKGEFYTPYVKLDANTGVCEVKGESYLEYTGEFYSNITDWLKKYTQEVKKPLHFNFKLTYFNTSSFKAILGVLKTLKDCKAQGIDVVVNWYYASDDEDILAEAQDLAEGSGIAMNFIVEDL